MPFRSVFSYRGQPVISMFYCCFREVMILRIVNGSVRVGMISRGSGSRARVRGCMSRSTERVMMRSMNRGDNGSQ